MRISRIRVSNFKSLVDFDLPLDKFTCLIGLNGSGKSTVLQFVDFLGQLMRGRMEEWFTSRLWTRFQIQSHFSTSSDISFELSFLDDSENPHGFWRGVYSVPFRRCFQERVEFSGHSITVEGQDRYTVSGSAEQMPIPFEYQGSILSQFRDDVVPEPIRRIRDWIKSIHCLDTLTPEALREPADPSAMRRGPARRNLASNYELLRDSWRQQVNDSLRDFYPKLRHPTPLHDDESNRTVLVFEEEFPTAALGAGQYAVTHARHVNDGMLRVMGVVTELLQDHSAILFDEIENGINPEIVEKLVDRLVAARQQIIVTTHSPMILNYLDDEVAKKSVVYLYKTDAGHTQAIRFFDIPSVAKKLTVMGPGEAFVDTKLSALAEEIATLTKPGAP